MVLDLHKNEFALQLFNLSHAGVIVKWSHVEHSNEIMTEPPPKDGTPDCR